MNCVSRRKSRWRNFSPIVVRACQGYAWPGNLTELEKFVKRYRSRLTDPKTIYRKSCFCREVNEPAYTPLAYEQGGSGLKSLLQRVKREAEKNAITAAQPSEKPIGTGTAARLLQISYRTLYKIEPYYMSPGREGALFCRQFE